MFSSDVAIKDKMGEVGGGYKFKLQSSKTSQPQSEGT